MINLTTPTDGIAITTTTLLDASGQDVTIDGGGVRGIFSGTSPDITLSLKNLTVTHVGGSGAINIQGATLNITNTTFSNNTTDGRFFASTAILSSHGSLNITNSLLLAIPL